MNTELFEYLSDDQKTDIQEIIHAKIIKAIESTEFKTKAVDISPIVNVYVKEVSYVFEQDGIDTDSSGIDQALAKLITKSINKMVSAK